MTLNIGRMTTGTAVAAQASENSAVQETDADDTLLTINVRTYAGMQDVSRQALERSEAVDIEIFNDLIADYFTKVDSAILNADGTSGTHLGIRSTSSITAVTYTDASPTVPELWPKLADAVRQAAAAMFAKPTAIVMHSRRWAWGQAALDSNNRPLFLSDASGPFNALAVGEAVTYGQVVGRLQALPVILDDNIPTNLGGGTEDVILIVSGANLRYWGETPDLFPRQFRFEQAAAPQSIRLAVLGIRRLQRREVPGLVGDDQRHGPRRADVLMDGFPTLERARAHLAALEHELQGYRARIERVEAGVGDRLTASRSSRDRAVQVEAELVRSAKRLAGRR